MLHTCRSGFYKAMLVLSSRQATGCPGAKVSCMSWISVDMYMYFKNARNLPRAVVVAELFSDHWKSLACNLRPIRTSRLLAPCQLNGDNQVEVRS